jgi:2-methylcitrate dehydratase PrpD
MAELTCDLARFVAAIDPAAIPERCTYHARTGMLDLVATMLAGARDDAVQLLARTVRTASGDDTAPQIPDGRLLAPADAALVNGAAGHVLDYDDVAMDGHPSAAMAPAILAEGWALGASGRDAIAAYVAGFELWALLWELEPGKLHERGFHPTAIWGTLAAAAACARLHRLDAERTRHAIAIASSLAAGTVANFGTMTKSLQVGRAAQAGVLAARLAKDGFTGSAQALEHPVGFLRAYSPSGQPDVARGDWGLDTWRLARIGLNLKRYPMCYSAHRPIDAMIALAHEHDLDPRAIAAIDVRLGDRASEMLPHREPATALAAMFSLEFGMAAAAIARRVGLRELTDEFVRRDDVRAVMRTVARETTTERRTDWPFAPVDHVSVRLTDGRVLAHPPVEFPRGSVQLPLSEAELREKFVDCAEPVLGARAAALFDRLAALETVPSLRELPLVAM